MKTKKEKSLAHTYREQLRNMEATLITTIKSLLVMNLKLRNESEDKGIVITKNLEYPSSVDTDASISINDVFKNGVVTSDEHGNLGFRIWEEMDLDTMCDVLDALQKTCESADIEIEELPEECEGYITSK